MRHKHSRRNSQEYLEELGKHSEPPSLVERYAKIGKVEKDGLMKGSFQSKNKFNPTKISDEQHDNLGEWQEETRPEARASIERLEGGGRARALKKLASKTEVRIKDGKKHFLLHRGMEDREHDNNIDRKSGKTDYKAHKGGNETNSWTPNYGIAAGFSQLNADDDNGMVDKDLNIHHKEPVSAWISEDDIHHYLPQAGDGKRKGSNQYKSESEVLVNHSQQHHLAHRDVVEKQARANRPVKGNPASVPRMRQIKDMKEKKPELAQIELNRRINSRATGEPSNKAALTNEVREIKDIKAGKKNDKAYLEERRVNSGVPNIGGNRHDELSKNPDLQHEQYKKEDRDLAASEVMHGDMYKGELMQAAKGLVIATAMASGVHHMGQKDKDSRAPASAPQEKSIEAPAPKRTMASIEADVDNMNAKKHTLGSISDVESSGGKNLKHARLPQHSIHQGESAFGKYGLTPLLIRETIKKHPDLKSKYGYLSNFKGNLFQEGMNSANKDGKLEDDIASRHYDRLAEQFGHSPQKIGHAWLNGISGTHRAVKRGSDINNHWHVKKIMDAYNKRSKK